MKKRGYTAAAIMSPQAPEPGTVTPEEGSRILIDGSYINGFQGTAVLDENMAVGQTITDKTIRGSAAYIKGSEAVVMKDMAADKWGLYSIEKGRWVVEPVYNYEQGRAVTLPGDQALDGYMGDD